MKNIRVVFFGIIFSIILIKSEAISWFRIQEMFHFHSFHMYGVLFSGIVVAFLGLKLLKRVFNITTKGKETMLYANIIGGLIFGIGWGITGACTGPIYSHIGLTNYAMIIVLVGAFIGTYIYAFLKNKLPHN